MMLPKRDTRGLIIVLLGAALLTGGMTWSCGGSDGPPNVLLLSIDTLRADHLGCYGYPRQTSPVIDALAEEALLYEDCQAPAPWTLPSHVAMLSGRHPISAGITGAASSIPATTPMVAERFAAAGYETVGFVDSKPQGFVGAERGFDRGFETFRHAPLTERQIFRYDMAGTVDAALEWLDGREDGRPFFLFLHTKSVHTSPGGTLRGRADKRRFPYDKPKPWVLRFLTDEGKRMKWIDREGGKGMYYLRGINNRIVAGTMTPDDVPASRKKALLGLYDAGILYTDYHLGRLLRGLRESGHFRNTIILVTADHGESFLEHQLLLHKEVHRQVLHVPLLLKLPEADEPRRLGRPVSLTDIPPTLLSLAGLEPDAGAHGRPLPLGDEGAAPEPRFASYRWGPDAIYEGYALEQGRWALLHHRYGTRGAFRTTLYDREADPGQFVAVESRPEVAGLLLEQLGRRLEQEIEGEEITLDAETREHLEALGYFQ